MIGSAGRSDNGVGEAAARAVLLATKLHVPAIGGELVHRATLLDALSAGRRRKLTLLSAPAGWGKTTLLAQWALGAGEDQRFGWLSLDRSDNDPVWFWMYVVAALQKVSPGVGTRAVELLAMGADPVQVVLPTLLNDLDTIASPMVLILDDYHLVVNRAVHEQLAFVHRPDAGESSLGVGHPIGSDVAVGSAEGQRRSCRDAKRRFTFRGY